MVGLIGLSFGGVLTALWGWQAVFWGSVFVAVVGVVVVWRVVSVVGAAYDVAHAHGIDFVGAAGIAALLLGVGMGIGSLALGGGTVRSALVWFGVAFVGLVVLLIVEP